MAKFVYYEVSCGQFKDEKTGNLNTYDSVKVMFSKRVNRMNMRGEKGELYSIPIVDVPNLFGVEKRFPLAVNGDYSSRISSVAEYLDDFLGRSCLVEQIRKNDRDIISYIEWNE